MTPFEFREVSFAYGDTPVLSEFSLSAAPATITAVIGPSGSGKTTLLRLLAGFERPSAGTVSVDGTVVSGAGTFVPPHRRGVGIVAQEGALFPHLRVRQNIAFGLRGRDRSHRARVEELLAVTGLTGLGDRYPRELSGGQQQRVAVARALAPRPGLVLLDEPFASLDPATRKEVRHEVRAALAAESAAAILVTHDHEEALALGDQVAAMAQGRLLQAGPPEDVYRRPADERVARLLGDANLVPAERTGPAEARSPLGTLRLSNPDSAGTVAVVRPVDVALVDDGVPARVLDHEYVGSDSLVTFELADRSQVLGRIRGAPPHRGADLRIGVRAPVHLV